MMIVQIQNFKFLASRKIDSQANHKTLGTSLTTAYRFSFINREEMKKKLWKKVKQVQYK